LAAACSQGHTSTVWFTHYLLWSKARPLHKWHVLVSACLLDATLFNFLCKPTTPLRDALTPATPVACTAKSGVCDGGCVFCDDVHLARICAHYGSLYMHLLYQQSSAFDSHSLACPQGTSQ